MLTLAGIEEALPAVEIPQQPTSQDNAWIGARYTIRLISQLPALRVHSKSNAVGRWFAIGDVILTREKYKELHALPGSFTHQDEWILPEGTILNVGIASPLFGHSGGALQAERLDGPPCHHQPIAGFWIDKTAHA